MKIRIGIVLLALAAAKTTEAADYPKPVEDDFIIKDFHFASGETLPELRMHYRTLGKPETDSSGKVLNAVLIMHGTTGNGGGFLVPMFAGELFGKNQLLDAAKYFIILPDSIGHGKSSKPSDGLHAKFPRYGYRDMIAAQHALVTEGLKVNHLRLVMGTSMGGMHTWLWGETYPTMMDGLLPLASLPVEISGRNRMWRTMISEAIRNDPTWEGGEYKKQPGNLRMVGEIMYFMSSNSVLRYKELPTGKAADEALDKAGMGMYTTRDANDILYAVESSRDYKPGPDLEKITAPLLAINFADDLINPPELKILEKEIVRVKHGKAIVMPLSDATVGHGTHTKVVVWKSYLEEFLKSTQH